MTYGQWLRLLTAKGHKLETVEDAVRGLGFKRGFSRTALSAKGKSDEPAPPKLVEYAWKSKLYGTQEDFEIYARHLASIGVEVPPELSAKFAIPPPPKMDPQEIVEGLAPKLDALLSPVGERLDSALPALAGKLDAIAASLRGKMDAFTLATESKLDGFDAKLGRIHAKADEDRREMNSVHVKLVAVDGSLASARRTLDGVKTTVDDTHTKVDVINAKLDQSRRSTVRAIWAAAGCIAVTVGVLVLLPSRSHAANCPEPGQLVASVGADGTPIVSNPRSWLSAPTAQLGEKAPKEQYVPVRPFPGQKTPPCREMAGEEAIYGGCWGRMDVKPPCASPDLFRSGDKCYRPIAADPHKPVGATP